MERLPLQVNTSGDAFSRNPALEDLLAELNTLLKVSEKEVLTQFDKPQYPMLLIVGCPRSGTTLLLQWLAASGLFGYPSNFISRFYQAPYIGAKIQQMLSDPRFAFRDEMAGAATDYLNEYRSRLGKTRGFLSPNEFWYFWRRFFPFREIQRLSPKELARVDGDTLLRELAALEAAFGKPLAMKAMIVNWHLPFIANLLDTALFLYIKREPLFTMQSLLNARQIYSGSIEQWYSFKPPEYEKLKDLTPYEQVAGQVFYTTQAIENGLAEIPASRKIEISYEEFCQHPAQLWQKLGEHLHPFGYELSDYRGPQQFAALNRVTLGAEAIQRLISAYETLTDRNIISPTEQLIETE